MNNLIAELPYHLQILEESVPAAGTSTEELIHNIPYEGYIPECIRHIDKAKYHNGAYFSAMVTVITSWSHKEKIGIELSFHNNGKIADIPDRCKKHGTQKGGAAFLFEPKEALIITPSVRLGLIAHALTDEGTAATLGHAGLANIILPPHNQIGRIIICDQPETPVNLAIKALKAHKEAGYDVDYCSINNLAKGN
jgi:hypothetical protein